MEEKKRRREDKKKTLLIVLSKLCSPKFLNNELKREKLIEFP
jgi:hypothetical protein